MRTRTSIAIVGLVVAGVALWAGLFGGRQPILKAAQGSGKGPRARLLVAEHPPRVLSDTAEPPRLDYSRDLKTQANLIKSQMVLSAALRDDRILQRPFVRGRTDPVAWLRETLEITNPNETEIIEIAMTAGIDLSAADQAAIINAVQRAYLEEVVNVELRRRMERLNNLKKLRDQYSELLRKRREVLRRLSESEARGGPPAGLERDAGPPLYRDLQSQRIKLRLERAEVEALLERRKNLGGAAMDAARKEMAQLEDRLAALTAGQKVIDEELERLTGDAHQAAVRMLEQRSAQEEIDQIARVHRKIAAEVEALSVELDAPPRVRIIDIASGR